MLRVFLFSLAVFLSALLLFIVQPLVGKLILPALGGSPAVWNTCMLFFQACLLAGYAYAHLSARSLTIRLQVVLHMLLLCLVLFFLPFDLSIDPSLAAQASLHPQEFLFFLLSKRIGFPIVLLSASAPLLQNWFSGLGESGEEPYFLYAASNAGSLLALLAYPIIIEPNILLSAQRNDWAAGYGGFAALFFLCGSLAFFRGRRTKNAERGAQELPNFQNYIRWCALAFIPSSLLLGITLFISTDVMAMPLLWIPPFGLYLLTYIIAFSSYARRLRIGILERAFFILFVLTAILIGSEATKPIILVVPVHLMLFFLAALLCHLKLAASRPHPDHLTTFYFCISIGGVLGGVFNTFAAPCLFHSVTEYPLLLVLACFAIDAELPAAWFIDKGVIVRLLLIPLLIVGLVAGARHLSADLSFAAQILLLIPSALLVYSLVSRPGALGLGAALLILGTQWVFDPPVEALFAKRDFFGAMKVIVTEDKKFRSFLHGTTSHGKTWVNPLTPCEPLSYFHLAGPFGDIMSQLWGRALDKERNSLISDNNDTWSPPKRVGVIGLGVGALACYGKKDDSWTFYELSPLVKTIAEDTRYFHYLHEAPSKKLTIVLGDGRLSLSAEKPKSFDLIVVDAFSSDSIPLHIITKESVAAALSKLNQHGMLAFNVSNNYFSLTPVLGVIAQEVGLLAIVRKDLSLTSSESARGRDASIWVVLAQSESDIELLLKSPDWKKITAPKDFPLWTDDYSSIFKVIQWN